MALGFGLVVAAGDEPGRVVVDAESGVGSEGSGLLARHVAAPELLSVEPQGFGIAARRGAGDLFAVVQPRACVLEILGPGQCFFHREDVTKSARYPGSVAIGGVAAKVSVLDAQGDSAAGFAVDEPGQGAAEALHGYSALGIGRDDVVVAAKS